MLPNILERLRELANELHDLADQNLISRRYANEANYLTREVENLIPAEYVE